MLRWGISGSCVGHEERAMTGEEYIAYFRVVNVCTDSRMSLATVVYVARVLGDLK